MALALISIYRTRVLEAVTEKGNATRSDTNLLGGVMAHQAELIALAAAIKRIYKHCDLTIYVDSVYIAECTGKWMKKWREADWKNAKGEQHSYYEWMKAEAERAEKDVSRRNYC